MMNWRKMLIGLLTVCLIGGVFSNMEKKAFASDEFDALREKWKVMLTGGTGYNTADPDIAAKVNAIETAAQASWNTMDTSPTRTRLWSNLGGNGNDIKLTYRKLKEMVLGYAVTGSALEGNTDLRDDIVSAMDWMYVNRYNENTPRAGNWWDWDIGSPLEINDIVVMMYDDFTPTQRTNYMKGVERFTPTVEMTGANRVWKATVVAVRGIIVKDSAKLYMARDGLGDVFPYSTSGDGFYRDGSFIQHSSHPYTGGYGKNLLSDLANVMYVLSDSTWEVIDTRADFVWRWVYDSFEPFLYEGAMMDMVRGREISRNTFQDHVTGHFLMQALIRLSQFAPLADANGIKSMVKRWIAEDTYRSYYDDASLNMIVLAKAIMNDSSVTPRGEMIVHSQFPQMDRVVHHRPGFAFGLSMHSTRLSNYESINAENKRGWHMADGMTYLYNSDIAQYSDDYWPTVNAYRLPGTTVVQNTTVASGRGGSNAVGGAILGEYGVVGMHLKPNGQSLDAKKSWFLFDNEIVALGANISSAEGKPVETIIDNRKLNAAGSNALTVDGTAKSATLGWNESLSGVGWAHLQGNATGADIGYYFPGSASLQGVREARTGKWSDINTYSSFNNSTNITRNYMTLWMDHGNDPVSSSYSYVVLPGFSSTGVSAYSSAPEIAVLENSAEAQAVAESTLGITAVQYWTNVSKTVGGITSDQVASVMMRETTNEIALSISDPTQSNTGTIQLQVNKAAACVVESDPAIAVTQLSPGIQLSVNVNGAKGKSHAIVLKKSGTCGGVTQSYTFETETLPMASSGDPHFVYSTDAAASGGKWRRYDADAVGDYIEHAVNVLEPGTYNVKIRAKHYNDRGIVQLSVQGANVGAPLDFYSSSSPFVTTAAGTVSFAHGGPKTLRFTVTGKHASSSNYKIPLDAIILERVGPAPSGVILETELLGMTASAGDTATVVNDSGATGGKVTRLVANAVGDYISYTVPAANPGTYRVQVRIKRANDRGQFQLYVDGVPQGGVHDQYAASQGFRVLDLGVVHFASVGTKTFQFQVAGTTGTGHVLVFDHIELIPE